MNEKNPYASPIPTEEESRTSTPVPQSFGQALRQGLKLGFKWGNRIALAICGLSLLAGVVEMVYCSACMDDCPIAFGAGFLLEIMKRIGSLILGYGYLLVIGIVTGVLICLTAHVVRRGLRLLPRG